MENIKKILDEISLELTLEMKKIIKAGGHIKTGLMYNSIVVECAYNPLANKSGFVFVIDAPYYFQYVNGNFELIKQLVDSAIYKAAKEKFKEEINKSVDTSQKAKSIIDQLGGFIQAAIKEQLIKKLL